MTALANMCVMAGKGAQHFPNERFGQKCRCRTSSLSTGCAAVRRLLWTALAVGLLLTVVPVLVLALLPPPTTAFMLADALDGEGPPIRQQWVPLDTLPAHVPLAFVAAEDQDFPDHHGFDLGAIRDALAHNADGGRVRGASTISQQVAKNLFLWRGRSWARKGLEAGYTVLIELLWSKRRILEVYLNIAELGPGLYGVGAAAQHYWLLPATALSPRQAALLAASLPAPSRYRADAPGDYVQTRADWIQDQMTQLGPGWLAEILR